MDGNYTRNLIKGKIAEAIFEEMFRTSGEFDILPIGYEHTTPILAQYQHFFEIKRVLENIRNAPDFALISKDRLKIFIVEVKYRDIYDETEIKGFAEKIKKNYDPSFIFLATNSSFYFSPCSSIIISNGKMEILRESWIKKDIQLHFSAILQEFITKNNTPLI